MVLAHIRDSNMNECVLRKIGKIHRFIFQKFYEDLEWVTSINPLSYDDFTLLVITV